MRRSEQALYLLFNEGYHGSNAESPLHPAMCADAIRLVELLLQASAVEPSTVHALAALFCFPKPPPSGLTPTGVDLNSDPRD